MTVKYAVLTSLYRRSLNRRRHQNGVVVFLLGDNAFNLFIIVRHNLSLKRISDAWEIFWTLSRGLKLF